VAASARTAGRRAGEPATPRNAVATDAARLLTLQRLAGNAAVSELLRLGGANEAPTLPVQRQPRRRRRPHGTVTLSGVSVSSRQLYVQHGPTCSAAALVSVLSVRDEDAHDPHHQAISAAMASVLRAVHARRAAALQGLERLVINGAARLNLRPSAQEIRTQAETLFQHHVLDRLAGAGGPITAPLDALDRLTEALFFAFLTAAGAQPGDAEIPLLLDALGLGQPAQAAPPPAPIGSFDRIFDNDLAISLAPGDAVRVVWWVEPRPGEFAPHAFALGRHADGRYYLHDQGPGYRAESDSLQGLRVTVSGSVGEGSYHLARQPLTPTGEVRWVSRPRQPAPGGHLGP